METLSSAWRMREFSAATARSVSICVRSLPCISSMACSTWPASSVPPRSISLSYLPAEILPNTSTACASGADSERVINHESASAKARATAVMPAVRLRQVVTSDRRCWTAAFIAL